MSPSNSTTREKVEVLGDGQQLVVDGIHPSGAGIKWWKDRAPWNTPRRELPTITEAQLTEFLDEVKVILNPRGQDLDTGPGPTTLWPLDTTDVGSVREANGHGWFDLLNSERKLLALRRATEVLVHAQYHQARTSGGPGYETWCAVGMALARSGVPEAEDLWVSFSQQAAEPDPESELRAKFRSFGPVGPITVGTLLGLAVQNGADFSDSEGAGRASFIGYDQPPENQGNAIARSRPREHSDQKVLLRSSLRARFRKRDGRSRRRRQVLP